MGGTLVEETRLMNIQTARLIIRDFELDDAKSLYELIYNATDYDGEFIARNGTLDELRARIEVWQSLKTKDDLYNKGINYAICVKESAKIVGAVTVNAMDYLQELQIGWYMHKQFIGNGYAGEAGTAVSDYLLETFNLEYMCVTLDIDNIASFRTAQKSGFKLFEKRIPYDYYWSKCDVENHDEISKYFENNQSHPGPNYYYFRKFNKNSKIKLRFFGDYDEETWEKINKRTSE